MSAQAGARWMVVCPDHTSEHRTEDAAERQAEAMDASERCWHTNHEVRRAS